MNVARVIVPALAAAAAPVPGAIAMAEPPEVMPPGGEFSFVIPADETPCGTIGVTGVDGETYRTFGIGPKSGATHVAGQLDVTLTSLTTGRSVELQIPGPLWSSADGTQVLTGPMLLSNPAILAYVNGKTVVPPGEPTDWIITGKRVDLCPVLGV
jgi:hypothetical protein